MNDNPKLAGRAPRRDRAARQRYPGARAPRDPLIRHQRLHAGRGRHADQRARRVRVGPGGAVHRARRERRPSRSTARRSTRPPGHSCSSGRRRGGRRPGMEPSSPSAGHPARRTRRLDWGEAWPFHRESLTAYGEQRYADALEAVRGGLEHMPDHAGPPLQLRVLRDARGRHRRRDVRPPPAGRRVVPAVPRAGAQGRRLRRRTRRPAVRGSSSLRSAVRRARPRAIPTREISRGRLGILPSLRASPEALSFAAGHIGKGAS